MARLQYLILGEYARVGPDGLTTIVGAGFDRVSVQALPAQQLLGLAVRVLLDQGEKETPVTLTLRPPSGYQMVFSSTLAAPPDARPHLGQIGVPLAVNLTVPLTVAGVYRLGVAVVGQHEEELTFEVEVREPAKQADL